jgi:outer membrane protein TolC
MGRLKTTTINGSKNKPGTRQLKMAVAALCAWIGGLPVTHAAAAELRLADAVRLVLENNASIKVQEAQVDAYRGRQSQAEGQFDTVLTSGANYGRQVGVPFGPGPQSIARTSGYRVGASRLLRNGASIGTELDASSSLQDNLPATQQGGTVRLGVTLVVPLLKGRGAQEVTAAEDAARLQVNASRHALHGQASHILQQTLIAYWTYSARVALHKVAISSEERSRNLLDSTQKLVDAAEKPRADLVLLNADLADKIVAREAAGLALVDAKNALGRLLGLDALAISALPEPADVLPAAAELAPSALSQLDALRNEALSLRADLRSLAIQIEAAERETQAARHRLQPALDLEVGASYAKATPSQQHFGFINDPGRNQSGPSLSARLNFQFPVQNKVANGALQERAAVLTQLSLQQRDLAASVANGVEGALQSLASSAAQLKVAQQALGLYEQAVNQEIVKQKNGISTLIDVINIEARFVNARVNMLQTRLAYANAMARLRYETGTLLPPASDAQGERFMLDPASLGGLGPLAGRLATSR